ncbi:hypothetical protein NHX12_020745 [Muraenolepis orangiensis]|uniref:Uncharacterized protein n=1 Tax=Muraenolepis orangiensis TaxID=630683 RepID=A0A9Q0EVG6_9TELE|nr:hypothetical protein NHX12_020745 [Muraenolepis orangiensis]
MTPAHSEPSVRLARTSTHSPCTFATASSQNPEVYNSPKPLEWNIEVTDVGLEKKTLHGPSSLLQCSSTTRTAMDHPAFCSGPRTAMDHPAFCSGPRTAMDHPAFCSGPRTAMDHPAFCSGPRTAMDHPAFCSGPRTAMDHPAFCSGPAQRTRSTPSVG